MPFKIPKHLARELACWNNGSGISLQEWVGCVGNFDLAVGYSTVFWPTFEVVGDYLLTDGWTEEAIKGFEKLSNSTPKSVEWVLNHLHLIDIHASSDVEPTVEHLLRLGETLKEIYSAKLNWQFPNRPCKVEFYIPEDADDLVGYQISFWQKKWPDDPNT